MEGKSIIYENGTDCASFNSAVNTAECYTSITMLYISIAFGLFGIFTNSQVLWCFGIQRKFERSSDQLAFIYGLLDTASCIVIVLTAFYWLYSRSTAACVFYVTLYILMTRTALYLFAFCAFNRYYIVCLDENDIGLFRLRKAKIFFILLIVLSLAEIVIQVRVGCYQYYMFGPVYIKYYYDKIGPPKTWLKIVTGLNITNWVLLAVITLAVAFFYIKIHLKDRESFGFNDAEYNKHSERVITKMFRLTAIFGLFFLYPQVIVQIIGYYYTFHYLFDFQLFILLTIFSDFLNCLMFVLTPFIYLSTSIKFREEIKYLWTQKCVTSVIYNKLRSKPDKFRFETTIVESDEEERMKIVNQNI